MRKSRCGGACGGWIWMHEKVGLGTGFGHSRLPQLKSNQIKRQPRHNGLIFTRPTGPVSPRLLNIGPGRRRSRRHDSGRCIDTSSAAVVPRSRQCLYSQSRAQASPYPWSYSRRISQTSCCHPLWLAHSLRTTALSMFPRSPQGLDSTPPGKGRRYRR